MSHCSISIGFIFFHILYFNFDRKLIPHFTNKKPIPSFGGIESRDGRQLDLFHWLFGTSRKDPSPQNNATKNESKTTTSPEPLIVGPIQISDIQNSSLKRVSLTPAFEKGLRDEIYRYNVEQNLKKLSGELQPPTKEERSGKSLSKRSARRTDTLSRRDKSSSQQLLKRQGLLYPQQQLLLQQQAAYQQQQQQQQLLALQNQRYGGIGRYNRRRQSYLYDYDDDSDSDEDDFDSDEFMSFPVRAGFIPPGMPGFRGGK